MKKIYLCRHGESEFNAKKIVQGHIDTDLTENGEKQALALAKFLKYKSIKKVISSDLKRAFKTANIVAKELNLIHVTDNRIREMHFGTWEGLSYDWIYKNALEHFQNWLSNPVKYPLPKQESIKSFQSRLKSFLDDIKNHDEESILVVGHGGSIQGMLCIAMGLDIQHIWKFKHNNTGLSLILANDKSFSVKYINMSYHIELLDNDCIIKL